MSSGLMNVFLLVPTFLFSLSFHEYAHAWMAVKRGDLTPQLSGRLSMHPLAHADILGTLILPTLAIYTGAPFFGWAKPVPIDIRNLRYGRRDYALVAAAGPLANLLLAILITGLLYVLVRIPNHGSIIETVITFSVVGIQVNLMLAFFNLLPLFPLDGFNIIHGFVPQKVAVGLTKMNRFSGILLIGLLLTGGFKFLSIPVKIALNFLLSMAS